MGMARRPSGPRHDRQGRRVRLGVAGLLVLLVVVAGLAALRPSGEGARPRPAGAGRGVLAPDRGVLAPHPGVLLGAWAAPSRAPASASASTTRATSPWTGCAPTATTGRRAGVATPGRASPRSSGPSTP